MSHGFGFRALVVFVVCCASSAVLAEDRGWYVAGGIGKGEQEREAKDTVYTVVRPPNDPYQQPVSLPFQTEEEDLGWSVAIGYRVNRYLAAELGYLDLGKATLSPFAAEPVPLSDVRPFPPTGPLRNAVYVIGVDPPLPNALDASASAATASVVASVPVGQIVKFYLRAGVAFVDQEAVATVAYAGPHSASNHDEVVLGGVGMEWTFKRPWHGRLEYQRTADVAGNAILAPGYLEFYSLTMVFSFGE